MAMSTHTLGAMLLFLIAAITSGAQVAEAESVPQAEIAVDVKESVFEGRDADLTRMSRTSRAIGLNPVDDSILRVRRLDGQTDVALDVAFLVAHQETALRGISSFVVLRDGYLVGGMSRGGRSDGRLISSLMRFDSAGHVVRIENLGPIDGWWRILVTGTELPDGRLLLIWNARDSTAIPEGHRRVYASLHDKDLKQLRTVLPAATIPLRRPASNTAQRSSAVEVFGDEIWIVDALTGRIAVATLDGEIRRLLEVGHPGSGWLLVGWMPAAEGVHVLVENLEDRLSGPILKTLSWSGQEVARTEVPFGAMIALFPRVDGKPVAVVTDRMFEATAAPPFSYRLAEVELSSPSIPEAER
jgi:hypothetical protein